MPESVETTLSTLTKYWPILVSVIAFTGVLWLNNNLYAAEIKDSKAEIVQLKADYQRLEAKLEKTIEEKNKDLKELGGKLGNIEVQLARVTTLLEQMVSQSGGKKQ